MWIRLQQRLYAKRTKGERTDGEPRIKRAVYVLNGLDERTRGALAREIVRFTDTLEAVYSAALSLDTKTLQFCQTARELYRRPWMNRLPLHLRQLRAQLTKSHTMCSRALDCLPTSIPQEAGPPLPAWVGRHLSCSLAFLQEQTRLTQERARAATRASEPLEQGVRLLRREADRRGEGFPRRRTGVFARPFPAALACGLAEGGPACRLSRRCRPIDGAAGVCGGGGGGQYQWLLDLVSAAREPVAAAVGEKEEEKAAGVALEVYPLSLEEEKMREEEALLLSPVAAAAAAAGTRSPSEAPTEINQSALEADMREFYRQVTEIAAVEMGDDLAPPTPTCGALLSGGDAGSEEPGSGSTVQWRPRTEKGHDWPELREVKSVDREPSLPVEDNAAKKTFAASFAASARGSGARLFARLTGRRTDSVPAGPLDHHPTYYARDEKEADPVVIGQQPAIQPACQQRAREAHGGEQASAAAEAGAAANVLQPLKPAVAHRRRLRELGARVAGRVPRPRVAGLVALGGIAGAVAGGPLGSLAGVKVGLSAKAAAAGAAGLFGLMAMKEAISPATRVAPAVTHDEDKTTQP